MDIAGTSIVFREPGRLLFVVPLVLALLVVLWREYRNARTLLSEHPILRMHAVGAIPISARPFLVRWAGLSLLVVLLLSASAEPYMRKVTTETIWGGVRTTFMFDVSKSMRFGHDVAPYADRLEAGKGVLLDFVQMTHRDQELRGSYRLALIPFAGEAMTYLSFTRSREEFAEAIDQVDETTVNAPGTNFLNAFIEYEHLRERFPPESAETIDIVVLLSDGGKGEGNRQDIPRIKAILGKLPKAVSVHTVGFGSVEWEEYKAGRWEKVPTPPPGTKPSATLLRRTVPTMLSSRDKDGKLIQYLLEDPDNPSSTVLRSELDEEILTDIALGRGGYYFFEGKDALLRSLKDEIVKRRKAESVKTHVFESDITLYFVFPAFLIACMLFGYFRPLRTFANTLVRPRSS